MSYENNNIQKENKIEREKYRRINSIEENNPWIQDSTTIDDINRQSSMIADHYIDNHLRAEPSKTCCIIESQKKIEMDKTQIRAHADRL